MYRVMEGLRSHSQLHEEPKVFVLIKTMQLVHEAKYPKAPSSPAV